MKLSASGKKALKITTIVIGSVIGFIAIALCAVSLILTPTTLTKMVNKYSNEYLDAQVKIDTVTLSLFSEFPYVSVKLNNGEIISNAFAGENDSLKQFIPAQADSLLKFDELLVSFSLSDLLFSKVNIKRIRLVKPYIYAYVSPWGKANWEIYAQDTTTVQEEEDSSMELALNVGRINIQKSGHITYDSRPDSLLVNIDLNRLLLRGRFSSNKDEIVLDRGYFSKFSLAIDKLSAEKEILQIPGEVPEQLTLKNEQIGTSIGKTSAKIMIDSLRLEHKRKGYLTVNALTHSDLKINNAVLAKDFPFEIHGGIVFDTTQALGVQLQDLKVTVAKIPVVFNGDLQVTKDSLYTNNICGRVENLKVSDFFKYIPRQLYPDIDKIKTNAILTLDVDVSGSYNLNTGAMPSVTAQLNIPDSYIEFKGRDSKIKKLAADIYLWYNADKPDSSGINIKELVVNGRGIQMDLKGDITDIARDPFIDIDFKAGIYLDTLAAIFPKKEGTQLAGAIHSDIKVKSRMSNLDLYKIGKANIIGSIVSDSLKIIIPQNDMYAMARGVNIVGGAKENTQDTLIQKGLRMLVMKTTVDSLYIRYKEEMKVMGSKLTIAGHNTADILTGDTKTVHPFNGEISANLLNIRGKDSLSLRLRNGVSKFSLLPYKGNYETPLLRMETTVRRLSLRGLENRYSIGQGDIQIEAVLNNFRNKEWKQRMEKRLDSLQKVYPTIPRDSLAGHLRVMRPRQVKSSKKDEFANEDLDLKVDKTVRDLIRQWDINGSITAATGRVTSPYFPLRTRMENMKFHFTTNEIEFKDTKIKSGETVLFLSGKLSGLKGAMLRNGKIEVDATIKADTLNFNELVQASNAGIAYLDMSQEYKDSLSNENSEDKMEQMIAVNNTDTTSMGLIIIPGNLAAEIDLDVEYGIYSKLRLNKVTGQLTIKDRCLQINNFQAVTSAGEMDLSAFYATRSKEDLSTGFDLELKNMKVERFIELMPAIDSLLPMLRSFEGKINCQLAATGQMDTTMNIILPTLRGVARIKGEDLVLMDGETFAMIAKKLKFKNRERNKIDRIAVELLLNDRKIEIFPFLMEMDRYRFAVSGTQNLDMSFDYHISVLQSPIPFRLGVTIFGSMDDFDFKIGKAKYKNNNLPVYSALIDSTRLNLRQYISNIYKIGVEAALNKAGDMNHFEKHKAQHEATLPKEMEALTEGEQQQLEQITPAESAQENEQ